MRATLSLGNFHRRMLAVYFAIMGPRAAYRVTEVLGRLLYRLLTPFRQRSEAQCRAALGDQLRPADVPRIAEQSFVHRLWNLTDLLLAERLLHPRTYQRFGGTFPEPGRSELLAAQERGQAALLVSAYYGPFDLLPIFLGYNGVRAAVVYLPHANAAFDAHRRRVRARGGCELVSVDQAPARFPQILAAGGTVALVADHHEARRGSPVTFLGLPTQISPSVGLLAWRYDADVVVAGIRRVNSAFHFAIEVSDVIKHGEWADQSDPVAYITARYLRALELLVRRDPTQYLWGYARWGEELAQKLTAMSPES
ncbi:MAG TPA: lysophospholipid acyltransferase family protein [Phycisphaerae bacterium]